MKIALSGEGSTDLGENEYGTEKFIKGCMTVLMEKLDCFQEIREEVAYVYKSEGDLKAYKNENRKTLLRGQFNRDAKLAYMFTNMLDSESPDIVIFFRDTDRVNSDNIDRKWGDKYNSIKEGLQKGGYDNGIAMIPKPVSESWLLCCCQNHQHCEKLEYGKGNMKSSNHPKKLLVNNCDTAIDRVSLVEYVEENCDPNKINMPSFNTFRDDLCKAIRENSNGV